MHARGIATQLGALLDHYPVVIVEGARGVGKSTLCTQVATGRGFSNVVDLTDEATRTAVERDPRSFVERLNGSTVIDEAQLVPELMLAIKRAIDRPGSVDQFLLTGSTRIARTGLGGSDPLAGRAATLSVRPFTLSERFGRPSGGVSAMLRGEPPAIGTWRPSANALAASALIGGIPTVRQVLNLPTTDPEAPPLATAVLERYVDASLSLAVDETANRYRLSQFARAVMAEPSLQLNLTRLGQQLEMKRDTAKRYFESLQAHHLLETLPAFRPNERQRITTHPKVFPVDLGVAAVSNAWDVDAVLSGPIWGAAFESLAVSEVVGQAMFIDHTIRPTFWRSARGNHEVDLVLESAHRGAVGFEMKASPRATDAHTKGLKALAGAVGERWLAGFVIHSGEWVEQLDDTIWAVPLAAVAAPADSAVS